MYTYENQKIIHVNKKKYEREFLQIGIDEWMEAYKELTASAFAVYLYLAGNTDGFDLALSQKAVYNKLRISKSTYHRAVNELEKSGYIRFKQGNIYEFFTVGLVKETREDKSQDKTNVLNEMVSSVRPDGPVDSTDESHEQDKVVSPVNTEIDKTEIIDTTYNYAESELCSSSGVAAQQEASFYRQLFSLTNIRDRFKLDKFLAKAKISAKEAVMFLEKHEEYTHEEWLITTLDDGDCWESPSYEEYFIEGYMLYAESTNEPEKTRDVCSAGHEDYM